MNKIQIIADSTCDLSPELIEKYNIAIAPLCILLDGKSYDDGVEITPDEIYEWSNKTKQIPTTAGLPMERFEPLVKPYIDKGEDVILFLISSCMSGTYNLARLAAEEYGRVFVIDSQNLSTGIGLQVIRAAELAAEGKTAEEIVEQINADREKVRASFVVDTLTFLARGGRCTAIAALMASTLKLHPQIFVKDGRMGVGKKFRGKLSQAVDMYVEDMIPALKIADGRRVFITHSGCSEELIASVKAKVESLGHFEEILITRAGGVISSHCGPNTLGVLYYEK